MKRASTPPQVDLSNQSGIVFLNGTPRSSMAQTSLRAIFIAQVFCALFDLEVNHHFLFIDAISRPLSVEPFVCLQPSGRTAQRSMPVISATLKHNSFLYLIPDTNKRTLLGLSLFVIV